MVGEQYFSIKMIEIQLLMWSTFYCPTCTFTLIFTFHPCWIIIFWSLKRGDCSISQLKNWLCQKRKKANITMWYEIFPLLCGHFPTQKVYIPHSLTSQKCWCLNKKSYKEEMLSSFSTFSYNLTTEILIHNSFINCICFDFLSVHYPKILTQNFLKTSKSTLFTLLNLKMLLGLYYLEIGL